MLKLAFVGNAGNFNTISGNFLPPRPPEPDPDPPRRSRGEYLASDWSIYALSFADGAFLLWSWFSPSVACLRWLPMAPTGLAFGGLVAIWLASLTDESQALHPAIWAQMKDAMRFFAVITILMPGAVRLVHSFF